MKTINTIKKVSLVILVTFTFSLSSLFAQTDTMYVMKAGVVINKQSIKPADVDSIIFYKPASVLIDPIITWTSPADIAVGTLLSTTQLNATANVAGAFVYTPAIGTSLAVGTNQDLRVDFTPTDNTNYNTATKTVKINITASSNPANLELVNIPAGTFTMGRPTSELSSDASETQHLVTLSAFRMSKYEITNSQYAAFLNAKGIGSDGQYAGGAYPIYKLISSNSRWGLEYSSSRWRPVVGYGNYPVVNVTWYGATEFATYVGGTLPTEAQWEYACRAGTTTPFSTGDCLSNLQANYNWRNPYGDYCPILPYSFPGKTQAVGTYPANAYGLHDMHGNVKEWCSDWYANYPTTAQTNPTGYASGKSRVTRGGYYYSDAMSCRSAARSKENPSYYNTDKNNTAYYGFRVVFVP